MFFKKQSCSFNVSIKKHRRYNDNRHDFRVTIAPESEHDLPAIKVLDPQTLPEGSTLYGDAAYNDYEYEDYLEKRNIRFAVDRKLNTKRPYRLEEYVNLRAD